MGKDNAVDNSMVADPAHPSLAGRGELEALICAYDWSATPLGPADCWPQSLRSVVSMLLASKTQIALFWGPEFNVLYNDAYRPVFGAKHPHALGLPGRAAWQEIWDDMLHALLAGVVRSGEAFHARDLLFVLERNGFEEETYFDVSYDPVRVESGAVGGVYCIVTETTERVVSARRMALLKDLGAQQTLARTTREVCELAMHTLTQHADDVLFALVYLDGTLASATPGAEAALAQADASRVRELTVVSPSRSGPSGRLAVGLNPRRPFDATYQTFLDLVANQLGTAIASARAYEEEKRRAEALAEIDRAKTVFFSNVSHEFRTPLTLILGPLQELLEDGDARPQHRERLELMHRNSLRLLKLVNTLLDFSRIEAGRVQGSFEPTDLAALTADLASVFRSAIERAGMELIVDCPALRDPVDVDRDMWEKIVLNLISNAFKYTLRGHINVSIADENGAAVLRVRDTGVGIPEQELDRIFDRFHRVEGTQGRTDEGTGIGLSLVKELVRIHRGTVAVESAPGMGSTFRVSLPFRALHAAQALGAAPRKLPSTALGAQPYVEEALRWLPSDSRGIAGDDVTIAAGIPLPQPTAAEGPRARLLLADDNADMRDYLERILRQRYDVEPAEDGAAALDAAKRQRPDLILADVMMPRLDGFGLLREVRADPALRTTPFLLVSARAGEEARVEGWEAGADDYLVKPFSAKELVARVATHLEMAKVRREAELAIRKSEERFRALTSATSDVVYCMSPDWREMQYLRGREFIADTVAPNGGWLDSNIHPDDQPHVREVIDRAIQSKRTFELEHRVIRVDGTVGFTHSRAVPIFGPDGEIVEWFGAATDITPQKEHQEQLREADRRKDEFLATLAHELRNPLAPIRTGIEVMRLAGNTPEVVERVRGIMERQLGHMVRLIDDLLDVSRITSGKIALQRQLTPLSQLIEGAIESMRAFITERRIEFAVHMPESDCVLDVDRTRFVQILSNLLHNAVKFTSAGGRIDVRAQLEPARGPGGQLLLTVADDGIGISPQMLPHVFELFTQDEEARSVARSGLGIGLTLVRRLVEMHGGTVHAHSEGRGRGTQIAIRMPVVDDTTVNEPTVFRRRPAAAGRRVLIIDDNADAADMLAMFVTEAGSEARVAHDGASGLAAAAEFLPDVVLLDIGMSGLDGYETCRRLRATAEGAHLLITALTGWGQESDKQRAVEAGFDAHLTKPADPVAVMKILLMPRNAPAHEISPPDLRSQERGQSTDN